MNEHDALLAIVDWLRQECPRRSPTAPTHYGYDLYLPVFIAWWVEEQDPRIEQLPKQRRIRDLFGPFANAAWDLCRRGVLRPGIRDFGGQETGEGSAGNGFTVTSFGRKWLSEADLDTFVPTEPDRFAGMLEPFR